MEDENNAAPSADAEQTLDSLSSEQHAEWMATGKLPVPDKTGDAATPTESGVEKTDKPESDAGKPNDTQQEPKKKGVKARNEELDADIRDLHDKLEKRAQLRKQIEDGDKGETQAPPAAKPSPGAVQPPTKPKVEDFDTYDAFEDARDKYFESLADYKAKEAVRIDRETRERTEAERSQKDEQAKIGETWRQRTTDAAQRHEDYAQVAFSDKLPVNQSTQAFMLQSEHGAEILYQLGSNIADAERISKLSWADTVRELVKIEQAISSKTPKTKTVTGSNPPPKEVGGFNKAPDDAVKSAIEAEDVGRYMEEMNRRDHSRRS